MVTTPRYLVGNGRGRPSRIKIILYQCPFCEDGNGAISDSDEMMDHFLDGHMEQETQGDFLREVRDFMEQEFAFIRGLLHK